MIRRVLFLRRNPQATREDYRRWWLEKHAPAIAGVPGMMRYTISLALDDQPYDGVAELWFADQHSLAAWEQDPRLAEARADVPAWIGGREQMLVGEEREIPLPGARVAGYGQRVREIAQRLAALVQGLMEQAYGLDEEQLNARPLADGNSIYVVVTHATTSAEYWVRHLALGEPMERDRAAEFRASGSPGRLRLEVADRVRRTLAALYRAPAETLERTVEMALGPDTLRWPAIHVAEHTLTHLSEHMGEAGTLRRLLTPGL